MFSYNGQYCRENRNKKKKLFVTKSAFGERYGIYETRYADILCRVNIRLKRVMLQGEIKKTKLFGVVKRFVFHL